MMFYPPFYRYSYNHSYWKNPQININKEIENKKESPVQEDNSNLGKKKENRNSSDSPFIEILGISLYFDDILLICLLLFLFEEGVDDQWLYIAIILLLLS